MCYCLNVYIQEAMCQTKDQGMSHWWFRVGCRGKYKKAQRFNIACGKGRQLVLKSSQMPNCTLNTIVQG